MLIPFKDDNPTRRYPFVTVALIALNCVVFIMELAAPMERAVFFYGAIPSAIIGMDGPQPVPPQITIFTSMFMHGGFLHLAGNMLYLWIFGNNVEDMMGPVRFTVFYLIGGIVSAYSHALSDPASMIPMVGASGAVSAVLGAYLLLFPRARVHTLIFLGIFIQVVRLPALIVIGFWAIIQFVNGMLSSGGSGGGVAWFAHVGGFLFGIIAVKAFVKRMYLRRKASWS